MDYNIEHYTIKDLEEMLNLKHPYTTTQVYQMETELKHKIYNDVGYTTEYTDMCEFISNGISKLLNETDVINIKKRLSEGDTCVAISKDYSVSEGTIRNIKKGRNWTHVM